MYNYCRHVPEMFLVTSGTSFETRPLPLSSGRKTNCYEAVYRNRRLRTSWMRVDGSLRPKDQIRLDSVLYVACNCHFIYQIRRLIYILIGKIFLFIYPKHKLYRSRAFFPSLIVLVCVFIMSLFYLVLKYTCVSFPCPLYSLADLF